MPGYLSDRSHMERWSHLINDYIHLHSLLVLNEEQENYLDKVLKLALTEPELNFLIQEMDYILAKDSGQLTEAHMEYYRNQQSKLSEHHIDSGDEPSAIVSLKRAYYANPPSSHSAPSS